MFCENCGNRMNDGEKFCTNCGWRLPEEEDVSAQEMTTEGASAQEAPAEESFTQENSAQEAPVEESFTQENSAQESFTQENPAQETTGETASFEANVAATQPMVMNPNMGAAKAGKKPSKKQLIFGGIAAGVVAVAVVGVVCFASASNFFRSTFSTPAKYYQYVEKKEIAETAASVSNIYQNLVLGNMNTTDCSMEANYELELSKNALRDLKKVASMAMDIDDVSCVKNVSLSSKYNVKDGNISGSGKLSFGKNDIVSGEVIFDSQEDTLYFQLPELYSKYIALEDMGDMTGYDSEEMQQVLSLVEDIYEKCPDKKTVEKLVYEYFCTAISCIDDVEKERTEIEAEGVSQKCIQLKATIKDETLRNMIVAVLQQMRDDKELEKIIRDMVSLEEDAFEEDPYDQFQDFVDEILEAAEDEDMEDVDFKLVLYTYVNSSGKVIGRQVKMRSEDEQMTVAYKMPEKGGKFGYELSVSDGYESCALLGSGKKSGNKLSGEFDVKYNKEKILNIEVSDYDTQKVKEGYLAGNFIFKVKGAGRYMGEVGSLLSSYRIGFDVKSDAKSANVVATLYDGEEAWATLSCDMKKDSGKKVALPSGKDVQTIEDEDDLMEIVEDFKFDKLKQNLKKANVPSEILDALEEIEDFIM